VRKKIIKNIRHVTFDEFTKNLEQVTKRLNGILADGREYAVLFDSEPHGSKRWVYELAKRGLARPPVAAMYYQPFRMEPREMMDALKKKAGGKLPGRIVVFDDAAYSGRQLFYILVKLREQYLMCGEEPPEVILAVPYMTAVAKQMFLSKDVAEDRLITVERMKTLDEILTEKEQRIIIRDVRKREGKEFNVYATVTYFDHRVADNFSFNEIIDEALGLKEMVAPPYWITGSPYHQAEAREYDEFTRSLTPPDMAAAVSAGVPAATGRIGKLAAVTEIDAAAGTAVVRDAGGSLHPVAMKRAASQLDVPALTSRLNAVVGPAHRILISEILRVIGKSPPAVYTFDAPVQDLFGFASPENSLIALSHALADNPVALFHEITEYLVRAGSLRISIGGDLLLVKDDTGRELGKVSLVSDGARRQIEKGRRLAGLADHYAVRALAREVFTKADEDLSRAIWEQQEAEAKRFIYDAQNRDILRALRPYGYLTKKYGHLAWKTLWDRLGDETAYRLSTECLPVLEAEFGKKWLAAHWDEVVPLILASGKNAERLVKESLPDLKASFISEKDFEFCWPGIAEMGAFAGEDVCKFFDVGIAQLVETYGQELQGCWPGILELGRTAGEQVVELCVDPVPKLKEVFGKRLGDVWDDIVTLGVAAGKENVVLLLYEAVPRLYGAYKDDFWGYQKTFGALGSEAGYASRHLFNALVSLKHLIGSEKELQKVGADALNVLRQCRGAEWQTEQALARLAPMMRQFPGSWSSFVKPVVYNQTVGAHLCLDAAAKIYEAGGVDSPADLAFILELIKSEKIRAYDLLENFIVPGLRQGTIVRPLSAAADSLRAFFDRISYRIIEVYRDFREDPAKARALTARCRRIHDAIIAGDASAVDADPLFGAILMHAFPPEVTTTREQYAALYGTRDDRPADTKDIPAPFFNKRFEVSTGAYTLKDAASPLNEKPWQTLIGAVATVNREATPPMGDDEVVRLGGRLLEDWQAGGLGRNRRELITELYRYARRVHGQTLPEALTTVSNVMLLKNFMGTTLTVLVGECVEKYAQAHPAAYQAAIGKMIRTSIDNPRAKAEGVLGLLSKFREHPAKLNEGLGRILGIRDERALADIARKLKGLSGKEQVAACIAGIRLAPRSGKEAGMIAHALQSDDYKAMQGEVSAKYTFNQSREQVKLRFTPSKRRAHGVAGLNMGVCVAPDKKLWDNPDFFNVVIFDEHDTACGGMHVLVVRDGDKKYLTLPGINPSTALLTRVSAEDIFGQCVSYARELAAGLGCDGLLIPRQSEIHSNRSEIQRVIAAEEYDTVLLKTTHPFAGKYAFRNCLVVPAAAPAPGPAETTIAALKIHGAVGAGDASAEYFGEQTPEEIDPQIRSVMSDPAAENYYFVQGLAGAKGRSDEGQPGALDVGTMYEEVVIGAYRKLVSDHPGLAGYDVVIVQGVSTSGHYGTSRKRIYLPIEVLKIGMVTNGRLIQMGLIEDFIEHEYLESQGAQHADVVRRLNRKRPGLRPLAVVAYRLSRAEQQAEAGRTGKALDAYCAALRALKKVPALQGRETEIDGIIRLIGPRGYRGNAAAGILKTVKNHFTLGRLSAERLDLAFELEKVSLLLQDRYAPGGRTVRLAAQPVIKDGVPVPAANVPFDRALADAWIRNSVSEKTKEIKREIIAHVRQVPFAEFEERLRDVTVRLNGILAEDRGDYVVVWDEDAHKSKRWVFSLAQKWLDRQPLDTMTSELDSYHVMKFGSFPKTVVIFEDASYSAKQLRGAIDNIRGSAAFHHAPVPRIIVAVPFMTRQARGKLAEAGVRAGDILSVNAMPTIEEIFGTRSESVKAAVEEDEMLRGGSMEFFGLNKTLVFFDHKAADLMSFADIVCKALNLNAEYVPPYKDDRTAYYAREEREYASFGEKRDLARIIKSGLAGYGNEEGIRLILKACAEEELGIRSAAFEAIGKIITQMQGDVPTRRDKQNVLDLQKELRCFIDEAA